MVSNMQSSVAIVCPIVHSSIDSILKVYALPREQNSVVNTGKHTADGEQHELTMHTKSCKLHEFV